MLSFKPSFSLSTFSFIKRLFNSSSLSAIRVVSSAYLRLLMFLPYISIHVVMYVIYIHDYWKNHSFEYTHTHTHICRRHRFDLWVGKISWRRKWQPAPVFLPQKSHGQRSLAGYSPKGRKELDMTEWLSTHTHTRIFEYLLPFVYMRKYSMDFQVLVHTEHPWQGAQESDHRDCLREDRGRLGMAWEGSWLSPQQPLAVGNFSLHHMHPLLLWLAFSASFCIFPEGRQVLAFLACWRDICCCSLLQDSG